MRYTGGKNRAEVLARIINLIPPHRIYIEPFLGSGAILRAKKPARQSYGLDKSPRTFEAIRGAVPSPERVELIEADSLTWLSKYEVKGGEFIYADPPYVLSTRGGRRYYEHEMTDAQHVELLRLLKCLAADFGVKVLLSGYASALYESELEGWNREEFRTFTRQHKPRTEVLWFNYPAPEVLHDHSRVGGDRRERWRIEKRRRRWAERLRRASPLERAALFSALVDVMGTEAAAAAVSGVTAGDVGS